MSDVMTSRAAPLRMRPRRLVVPDPLLPQHAPAGTEAVVVGGGIAGISAAVVLAERGVAVTVLEAAGHLDGRLGAWPERLHDGTEQIIEHGFHAFFRHYYTWRAILRRWRTVVVCVVTLLVAAAAWLVLGPSSVTATAEVSVNVISTDPFSPQRTSSELIDPATTVPIERDRI